MATKQRMELVEGILKPIASAEEQERARKDNRLMVMAADDGKIRTVPNLFARLFSTHWEEQLKTKHVQKNGVTLLHKPKAVQFVVDWMKNGGMDDTGPEAVAYPTKNLDNLESLRNLVDYLGIKVLLERVNADIATIHEVAAAKSKANAIAGRQGKQAGSQIADRATPTKPRGNVKAHVVNAGRRQPGATVQRCSNCNSPNHARLKCPVLPYETYGKGGRWLYGPANLKSEQPLAVEQSVNSVQQPSDVHGKKELADEIHDKDQCGTSLPDQPGPAVSNTAAKPVCHGPQVTAITDASPLKLNFVVYDQEGNEWFVPRSRIRLKVEGINGNGKLIFSGHAPLEYSWYPFFEEELAGLKGAQANATEAANVGPLNKDKATAGSSKAVETDATLQRSDSDTKRRSYKPWIAANAKRPKPDRKGKGKEV